MFFCNLSTKNNTCLKSVKKEKELTLKHIQINQYSSIEVMICKNCLKDFPGLLDEPVKPLGLFKGVKDPCDDNEDDKTLPIDDLRFHRRNLVLYGKEELRHVIKLLVENNCSMLLNDLSKKLGVKKSQINYYCRKYKDVFGKSSELWKNQTRIHLLNRNVRVNVTQKNKMIALLEKHPEGLTTTDLATKLNSDRTIILAMACNNKDIFKKSLEQKPGLSGAGKNQINIITLTENYKDVCNNKSYG